MPKNYNNFYSNKQYNNNLTPSSSLTSSSLSSTFPVTEKTYHKKTVRNIQETLFI